MKKAMVFLILLSIVTGSFGQQLPPERTVSKQDYLQKSKNQTTTAWIMVGGGIATAITGIAIYRKAYNEAFRNDPLVTFLSIGMNVNPTGAYISMVGMLAALGSIPFFISAGKNKNLAMSVSLNNEITPVVSTNGLVYKSHPTLLIKISL